MAPIPKNVTRVLMEYPANKIITESNVTGNIFPGNLIRGSKKIKTKIETKSNKDDVDFLLIMSFTFVIISFYLKYKVSNCII